MNTADSIREMRRRGALARDIVADHTGPLHKIIGWARKYPVVTIAAAIAAGALVALILRRRK